jgi:hypothetical protein
MQVGPLLRINQTVRTTQVFSVRIELAQSDETREAASEQGQIRWARI